MIDTYYRGRDYYSQPCPIIPKHVHELQGSVKIAGRIPHDHRFCTVSCEAIPCGRDHIHEVFFRTDTFGTHHHEFKGKTGGAIYLGDRHIHCFESVTTVDEGHSHRFEVATLIENPTGDIVLGEYAKDIPCK